MREQGTKLNGDTVSAINQPNQLSSEMWIAMNLRLDGLLLGIDKMLENPNTGDKKEELLSKIEELKSIQDEVLKKFFEAFDNDYDAILETGKQSACTALEDAYFSLAFWESDLGEEVKQKLDTVTDTSEVFSDKYLRPKLEEWFSSTDTDSLERKPIFTIEVARSIVNTSVHHILDYLVKNSADHANEFRKAIDSIIKESPYVYEEGAEPTSKTNSVDVVTALATERLLKKEYMPFLNGIATNQLTNISTRSNPPIVDAITGNATIKQGTLKVFIDSYNELTGGLRTSTHKLLDACTIALTQQNSYRGKDNNLNPLVTIPLEHFMELCGIPLTKPSKDKTRRKVKEDLDTLYHISMEWTETSRRKTKDFAKMRLCDKVAFVRGNIIFSFSMDMAKYLTNAYIMQYPMELLKVDERNPNSYHIGKKLLLHNSIDNNRRKGTANILSVKKILEVCPDIPTYEQVLATDRALERRIKVPFETALNSLSSFVRWEYCNSKGVPLTEEQLQATDYGTFEKLFIKYDVLGVPDQTARLEARAEEAKARADKKKRTSSKKKKNKPT